MFKKLSPLLLLSMILTSGSLMAASMEVKRAGFGLRFENQVHDKNYQISNVKPTLSCSTTYMNHVRMEETVSNTAELKHTNYPEQFKARFDESHYFQMVINREAMVEAPKKTFYENKECKFGVTFDVSVLDENRAIIRSGSINAVLYKSDREVVDLLAELNALPPMKFFIKQRWFGIVEFEFSEGGSYTF